jgi:hypothetical protein
MKTAAVGVGKVSTLVEKGKICLKTLGKAHVVLFIWYSKLAVFLLKLRGILE